MWLLLTAACVDRWPDTPGDPAPDGSGPVPLRWVRGYEGDTWEQAQAGLWWQLANLGALPPADGAGLSVARADADEVQFTLDLDAVGFPEAALPAVHDAVGFVAGTDEVAVFGGLDLGAFFLKTLYEPWHYYAITGACGARDDWTAAHLAPDPARYAITESLLVAGDRLDQYTPAPASPAAVAHLVEEGEGAIADGSFVPVETESIDILPNGMLRYAVYDDAGEVRPWGEASPAGQPGRCMWCHEDHLQPGLATNTGVEGYVATADFLAEIDAQTDAVAVLRAGLSTALVWDPPDAHEDGELFTETWLLPSPGRLAREWAVDEGRVRDALDAVGATWTAHPEYPDFGELVSRADAERAFAALLPTLDADADWPYAGTGTAFAPVETLPSAREPAEAPLVWGDPGALRCE